MGKGGEKGGESGEAEAQTRSYTWEEIQKHNLRTDKWLVIERKVYNVTQWADRHPGGHRVISHCAGEDATVRTPKRTNPGGRGPAPASNLLTGRCLPGARREAGRLSGQPAACLSFSLPISLTAGWVPSSSLSLLLGSPKVRPNWRDSSAGRSVEPWPIGSIWKDGW